MADAVLKDHCEVLERARRVDNVEPPARPGTVEELDHATRDNPLVDQGFGDGQQPAPFFARWSQERTCRALAPEYKQALVFIEVVRLSNKEGFAFGLEKNRLTIDGQADAEVHWDGIGQTLLSE